MEAFTQRQVNRPVPEPFLSRYRLKMGRGVCVLFLIFFLVISLSLLIGARAISPLTVWHAFTHFDTQNTEHLVVRDLRSPRTIAGCLIGVALGVSGALMQAITRNPLADSGLLGINAGAAFGVILGALIYPVVDPTQVIWFAFFGAAGLSTIVFIIGTMGHAEATPVRLALTGAALSAFFLAIINAIILTNQETLEVFRYWMVGSIGDVRMDTMLNIAPYFMLGTACAIVATASLDSLALGKDMARSLGVNVNLTKLAVLCAVSLLCGTAVALAGPIGFVGLVVPHIARVWCGQNQTWIMIYATLLGPTLVLLADICGRVILPNGEVQVGIMTMVIGGPVFIGVVRKMRLVSL